MLVDFSRTKSVVTTPDVGQPDRHDFLVQVFRGTHDSASGSREAPPTVLLDRDGVINVNRPDHVTHWSDFAFIPAALEGLGRLRRNGWQAVVLTNQSAVNRGQLTAEDLVAIHERMAREVRARGGEIA